MSLSGNFSLPTAAARHDHHHHQKRKHPYGKTVRHKRKKLTFSSKCNGKCPRNVSRSTKSVLKSGVSDLASSGAAMVHSWVRRQVRHQRDTTAQALPFKTFKIKPEGSYTVRGSSFRIPCSSYFVGSGELSVGVLTDFTFVHSINGGRRRSEARRAVSAPPCLCHQPMSGTCIDSDVALRTPNSHKGSRNYAGKAGIVAR